MTGYKVRDQRGRWAQVEKVDGPGSGRKSSLPSGAELAAELRAGATRVTLAQRYGVHTSTITAHLSAGGWNATTGQPDGWIPRRPLTEIGAGPGFSCTHVGGGDNPGVVPLGRVVHTHPRSRPRGIIWTTPAVTPSGGCATAGVPAQRTPRRPGPPVKLDDAQRAEIATRYQAGESSTVLGRDYGVDPTTIVNALRQAGVEIRTLSAAARARHRRAVA